MTERVYLKDVAEHVGATITVDAWVQIIREHGKLVFFILRDVTGVCQAVAFKPKEDADQSLWEAVKSVSPESVIQLTAEVQKQDQAPGGHELVMQVVTVLSQSEAELPIPVVEKSGNETDQSLRLDYRWLDLRKPEKLLIFKVWTTFEAAFRQYWIDHHFLEMHSPKLMSAPSESGAGLFEVKYFDGKAYLAQSPQFYKQMAMASGFERVFEVGAVYRAEPSFTTRHATEFTGYDFEMSFIESHEDVMQFLESAIAYVVAAVKEKHGEEIKALYNREVVVPTVPFPRVTMADAKEMLQPLAIEGAEDGDLNPEEERKLSELIKEKFGHEFVYVTEYPSSVRPFYHMRFEDRPDTTKSFDLMWNGVEITTGAQREHRYETLLKQAEEKGLTKEGVGTYLDYFRFGCPPHGGAGIGPTRMIMKLFDAENIREVTYLHRGVNRLTP